MNETIRINNRLAGKQLFDLQVYTNAEYKTAGLSDKEFAEKASKSLGFPVTGGNIQGVREAFGITATMLVRRESSAAGILARIEAIENWIRAFDKEAKP